MTNAYGLGGCCRLLNFAVTQRAIVDRYRNCVVSQSPFGKRGDH
jgi:hypothetical protein